MWRHFGSLLNTYVTPFSLADVSEEDPSFDYQFSKKGFQKKVKCTLCTNSADCMLIMSHFEKASLHKNRI